MIALFKPEQFTPTRWDTAADKAKFANELVAFISGGFVRKRFTGALYKKLALNTFGHIANYDIDGFYHTWFSDERRRKDFIRRMAEWTPTNSRPADTWCDVEAALRAWATPLLGSFQATSRAEEESRERAELRRLLEKYPDEIPRGQESREEDGR